MTISFITAPGATFDNLVVPLTADQVNDAVLGTIETTAGQALPLLKKDFKAELCEVFMLYTPKGRLFLLGLGKQPGFEDVLKAFRNFSFKHKQKLTSHLHLNLMYCPENDHVSWLEAAVNGLSVGTYQVGKYKSENGHDHPLEVPDAQLSVWINDGDTASLAKAADRGLQIADTQMRIFDLVNAPGNKKNPASLAAWAVESGNKYGYEVTAYNKEQITEMGLEALLAVNRGSEDPAYFIVMKYGPKGEHQLPLIGLVGKGVTFDTGGLSIKPSANMHYMKSDMGGAAAVFGAFEAAARLQLPVHLVGVVPSTDNSVDALSVKPGDVIGSYSGKTIEVIDTDAEGRLILADGLAYIIRNYNPQVVIDLATLTGSAVRTFGYHAGAMFANSDALAETLSKAGDRTGERLWRLPIWDAYKDDIKSDVADVRNFSGKPTAGAIAAAKFLEAFIGDHPNWAHLDIAGVAFNDTEYASQKAATAFGVRLLLHFFEIWNTKQQTL